MRYTNHLFLYFLLVLGLISGLSGCMGDNELPFPGTSPRRVVFGTPPPTINPAVWFGDVKNWGAETYLYHSPHFQGNLFRRRAGQPVSYAGDHLRSIAFLSGMDGGFQNALVMDEINYQEQLAKEAYQACLDQELDFYYSIPFPLFPVQEAGTVQEVYPDWFDTSGHIDFGHPELPEYLSRLIETYKAAMPEMKGINLILGEGYGNTFELTATDLEKISEWLPALLEAYDSTCRKLGIAGMIAVETIRHTNKSRHDVLAAINRFPSLQFFTSATWPEETTRMPYLGYWPPADTLLLKKNPLAVSVLTDTEFLGQGQLPSVLPAWWKYLAQQSHLREADMVVARAFIGDQGESATNFNRLNVHLMLHFLQHPRAVPKTSAQMVAEEMFGSDFPSRLSAVIVIAEDALEAVSSINYINVLDQSKFPPPSFLDQDFVKFRNQMKAVDILFEPPGTPLYIEDVPMPDTLHAGVHWRWQTELIAKPVDQMLLGLEQANDWLDRIQKEVDYLTLDFPPAQRQQLMNGYRDLLLYARGIYQYVQGAAVYHRWYRLKRISREEALAQLAPIAAQLRLIAADADGAVLELQQRLTAMAVAFETLSTGEKINETNLGF